MMFAVTLQNGRVAELFWADRAPAEAVPVPDDVGEILRGASRFADYIYQNGALRHEPEVPVPTVADYVAAVQRTLDDAAKAKGYDGILSAASYAAVAGPFQAEGIAFAQWRSACWAHCYTAMDDVQDMRRSQPTVAALLGELPVLVLP